MSLSAIEQAAEGSRKGRGRLYLLGQNAREEKSRRHAHADALLCEVKGPLPVEYIPYIRVTRHCLVPHTCTHYIKPYALRWFKQQYSLFLSFFVFGCCPQPGRLLAKPKGYQKSTPCEVVQCEKRPQAGFATCPSAGRQLRLRRA
eukprot:scaffold102918_cov67-Phaeocystis_antarctica.AAC.1